MAIFGVNSRYMILYLSLLIRLNPVEGVIDQICVSFGTSILEQELYKDPTARTVNPEFCSSLRVGTEDNSSIKASLGLGNNAAFKPDQFGEKILNMYTKGLKEGDDVSCVELLDNSNATSAISITVTSVKHNKVHLSGWLSFQVKIPGSVHWAFTQVSDENGDAIGEFVSDVQGLCGLSSTANVTGPENYFPCSAAGPQEPKVAQAVVYTNKKDLNVQLLWKLNEYYCNRHEKFRVVAFFSSDEKVIFYRDKWFYPQWFGVADIVTLRKDEKLRCTAKFPKKKDKDWWLKAKTDTSDIPDNLQIEEGTGDNTVYQSCRTFITRSKQHEIMSKGQPSFGGRCIEKAKKKFTGRNNSSSSVDMPHSCKNNSKATYLEGAKMENYITYLNDRNNRWKEVYSDKSSDCHQLNATAIKQASQDRLSHTRFSSGKYAIRPLSYHGWFMSWAFFVLIPVSNFLARYYKETFMDMDVLGFKIWYVFHFGLTLAALGMIISALTASLKHNRVYGRSFHLAAQLHSVFGYICVALFLLSILLGPLRPVSEEGKRTMMIVHAAFGFFTYFVGMCLIVSSTAIPGSPSASQDKCYSSATNTTAFSAPFQHNVTTMVLWWLALDVFLHFVMNRLQRLADRAWNIKRAMFFPIVPIVRIEDKRNFKFFRYRLAVLAIYIGVLAIFISVLGSRFLDFDWRSCDLGFMTCKHKSDSLDSSFPELQCGKMAEIRRLIS